MAVHRYWRVLLTSGAAASYAFSEIQFRVTAGTSLAFSGGTASAGQVFGGTPGANDASKAADGNTSTLYSSIDKTGTQFWQYDFGATSGNWRDVAEIAMTARTDSQPTQAPIGFTPQFSDDGSSWTGMGPVVAAVAWTLGLVQLFAVVPDTVSATYTAWNPADKDVGISLSGNYLVATNNSNAGSGVRATTSQTSGKYYWEVTCNTFTSANDGVGVLRTGLNMSSWFNISGSCGVSRAGSIIVDNSTLAALGTITSGTVVCLAIDLTAKLLWIRSGVVGNWNNSGTANPATATGGFSTPNLGGAFPAFPFIMLVPTFDKVTANFGAAAFAGVVPSGFSAGWPVPAVAGAAMARAMVLA